MPHTFFLTLYAGFFEFLAKPLFKAWTLYFDSEFSYVIEGNVLRNKTYWDNIVAREGSVPIPPKLVEPSAPKEGDSAPKEGDPTPIPTKEGDPAPMEEDSAPVPPMEEGVPKEVLTPPMEEDSVPPMEGHLAPNRPREGSKMVAAIPPWNAMDLFDLPASSNDPNES
jgi:hypothetical protein